MLRVECKRLSFLQATFHGKKNASKRPQVLCADISLLEMMMMMVMVDRSHAINARESTNALGSTIEVAGTEQ